MTTRSMSRIFKPKAQFNLSASTSISPIPSNPKIALADPNWRRAMTDFVYTIGFRHSKSDHSLFIYHRGKDIAYLLLYVDDIILATSSDHLRGQLMAKMACEFAMKDLGPLSSFLGISVNRSTNGLFIDQSTYARDIIQRAGMTSCNPVATPVDTQGKQSATLGNLYPDPTYYRSLAGALQYLTFTRPDISYAVQHICLHMHSPHDSHMLVLKRIIRYIKETLSLGLFISKSSSHALVSYTDADWAS
ncbi:uncharacterized mitochondrial protein AtMg00810-like [Rutidosis leptorrhynchoides]|uniref:uncharacterized mitochondrial protein AtMg00810-like n=1 Tax=Rutidosis leptorrhynchoides TaxID=125765 RepID=UPI003A9A23A6